MLDDAYSNGRKKQAGRPCFVKYPNQTSGNCTTRAQQRCTLADVHSHHTHDTTNLMIVLVTIILGVNRVKHTNGTLISTRSPAFFVGYKLGLTERRGTDGTKRPPLLYGITHALKLWKEESSLSLIHI